MIVIIIVFLIFFYKSIFFLDPDFGWHLKMGEIISHSGIPKTDFFSYTTPGYGYIDHSWFSDFLIFKIYSQGGLLALSLIFSFIAILTLWISTYLLSQKSHIKSLFILLAASIIIPYFGIRTQVISWLLLPVLIIFLQKYAFLVPFIILLWVNLHGSFALGIVIVFLFLVSKSFSQKTISKNYLLVFLLSIVASFINPYGINIYKEVENTSGNFLLRFNIQEWIPGIFFVNPPLLSLLTISIILFVKFRSKFLLSEKLIYIALLLEAFSANRHIPLFTIIAIPIVLKGLNLLRNESKKIKFGIQRFEYLYKAISVVVVFSSLTVFVSQAYTLKSYSQETYYPKNAINYFSKSPPKGELFSTYGWGGYLIWQLPSKKVFIDGRMPSWKTSTFGDYLKVTSGQENFETIVKKYNIHTVLWPQTQKQNSDLYSSFVFFYKKYITKNYKDFDFLKNLKENGWEEVYKDNTSIILVK